MLSRARETVAQTSRSGPIRRAICCRELRESRSRTSVAMRPSNKEGRESQPLPLTSARPSTAACAPPIRRGGNLNLAMRAGEELVTACAPPIRRGGNLNIASREEAS